MKALLSVGGRTARAALISLALVVIALSVTSATAQSFPVVFTATAIASQGTPGSTGRVRIRITALTSEEQRKKLNDAFKNPDQTEALALLRTMTKGFVNIEGQQGRKIEAAFFVPTKDGTRVILIGEHILTKLEISRGAKQSDYPLAAVHIQLDKNGEPLNGEFFPAVKLSVSPDGFVDVQTNDANKVMLYDLARQ
jgi:hypothetical protein